MPEQQEAQPEFNIQRVYVKDISLNAQIHLKSLKKSGRQKYQWISILNLRN